MPKLSRTNYNRFDLKGCADDKTLVALGKDVVVVHRHIFNMRFWTEERKCYFEGKLLAQEVKFHVSPAAHYEIM